MGASIKPTTDEGLAKERKRKREYMVRWRKTGTGSRMTREQNFLSKYGLTLEQRARMWASQDGRCAVCGVGIPLDDKKTHIDHCHETGKIRGILCQGCNIALGQIKDDVGVLRKMIAYLERV